MAHNTKPQLTDAFMRPIAQYYDPLADDYYAAKNKVEIVRLVNNKSFYEYLTGSGGIDLGLTGQEKEVWIYVVTNKGPTILAGDSLVGAWADEGSVRRVQKYNIFPVGDIPDAVGHFSDTHLESTPMPFLYIPSGLDFYINYGETPQTFEEARKACLGYRPGLRVSMYADFTSEDDPVIVSLWVVKIYD